MQVKRGSETGDKIWIHVTFEVDGEQIEYTNVAPQDLTNDELQKYADEREHSYRFDVLRDMYPDCPKNKKADLMRGQRH